MADQAQLLRQIRLALQTQDFPAAISGLEQAARESRADDDRATEGRHLGNLALLYYRIGEPDKALGYFEQALACARAEGDRATEDGLLGNVGNILRELRRFDEAVNYLNLALLIAQEIGDVRGRGIWLGNLGLVYDDLEQPAKALDYHLQSIAVARQLQDKKGLAARLGNLGNSYVSLGEYENAASHFSEAAVIFRALGDKQALALRLGILGNLHTEIARRATTRRDQVRAFGLALDYYQQTLTIARELADRATEAELLRSMGGVFAEMQKFADAAQHLRSAEQIFAALSMSPQLARTREVLALVQAELDRPSS